MDLMLYVSHPKMMYQYLLPDCNFKNEAIQNPAIPSGYSHLSHGFPVALYNTIQGRVFVTTTTAVGPGLLDVQ